MPINFTIHYDHFASDINDDSGDIGVVPLVGHVRFVPKMRVGTAAIATGALPRPAGFTVREFSGYLDVDGRLKNKRGGTPGVRLWANDPIFELARLPYTVIFDLRDPIGNQVKVDPISIPSAPSTDVTLNLTDFTAGPNITAVAIPRVVTYEINDEGYLVFYVNGVAAGPPIPLPEGGNGGVTIGQVNAAVSTAIANLRAGAPDVLDTLVELATALGNNPNLAADVTAALAAISAELADVDAQIRSDMTAALSGKLNKPEGFPNADKIIAGDGTLIDPPTGPGGSGLDAEGVRDTIAAALQGAGLISVVPNDADNTITISLGDLNETVQDIVAAFLQPGTNVTKDYNDATNTLTISASGGSALTNDAVIGDGTIGPFTVTHNRGTRNVDAVFYETVGANTGREVDILWRRISKDAIRIEPSIPIPVDGIHVHLEARPTDDVAPPSTPTVSFTAKTSTTATFTAASTDSVGVVAYNWFKDGNYVTTVYGSGVYTFTGLTPGTGYPAGTFTAVAFDRAGNESAPGAYGSTLTTSASAVVVRNSAGQGRSTAAVTLSWNITVAPGTNTALEAFVLDSHAGWFAGSTIDVHTLTSSVDGPLTEVAAIDTGPGGQDQGTLRAYVLGSLAAPTRPTPGVHTLTATVTEGGYTPASLCGVAVAHDNVASITGIVTNRSTAQNAVNQTIPSAVGDFNLQAVSYDAAPPTAGNRTQVGSTVGGSVGGMGDFLFVQEATGAATSQAFTTTGNQWHAEIGMRLVKAV